MNIALWILQVILALLCVSGGIFQIFKFDELRKGVVAMQSLPRGLWAFLGVYGCLGGVALIVPAALGIMPAITAYAAAAIAVHSLLISAFYIRFRDRTPLP